MKPHWLITILLLFPSALLQAQDPDWGSPLQRTLFFYAVQESDFYQKQRVARIKIAEKPEIRKDTTGRKTFQIITPPDTVALMFIRKNGKIDSARTLGDNMYNLAFARRFDRKGRTLEYRDYNIWLDLDGTEISVLTDSVLYRYNDAKRTRTHIRKVGTLSEEDQFVFDAFQEITRNYGENGKLVMDEYDGFTVPASPDSEMAEIWNNDSFQEYFYFPDGRPKQSVFQSTSGSDITRMVWDADGKKMVRETKTVFKDTFSVLDRFAFDEFGRAVSHTFETFTATGDTRWRTDRVTYDSKGLIQLIILDAGTEAEEEFEYHYEYYDK